MRSRTSAALAAADRLWPGCALSAVIALAAYSVSTLHGGPQLLYALFFGIAFHHLAEERRTRPGIEFCARTVLRLGVGLLGARITADQVASLGWTSAAVVVVAVASTIGLGAMLARHLRMPLAQGILSGGSVAICGASAALAISAVLPKSKDAERFTLLVVVSVTALSTAAMILYPLLARALHLDPHLAGLFLGGTIHDVAQVVGAGYTLGQETGDFAIIVKLFRVALLAVVVLAISLAVRAHRLGADRPEGGDSRRAALVPWFLWLFVALAVSNSVAALPAAVPDAFGSAARICLVLAIAALGVKTSFQQLTQAGWRPFTLIAAETAWIGCVVLGAAVLSGR